MEQIQRYISTLQSTLGQLSMQAIAATIDVLQQAREQGNQVFIFGNGGSASTASHFACDLSKNTQHASLPTFRAFCLNDNIALLSAYANDEGYENVFLRQLVGVIRPGDVVIAISASGNSKNVLNAVEEAQKHNVTTIGLTGFDGGSLASLVNIHVHVNSHIIEQVEDVHLVLEHMIIKTMKEQIAMQFETGPSSIALQAGVVGS